MTDGQNRSKMQCVGCDTTEKKASRGVRAVKPCTNCEAITTWEKV